MKEAGLERSRGAVDALRAEFESVDTFYQALLGLRSVCAEFDGALDELANLEPGATEAWARTGLVPGSPGPGAENRTTEASSRVDEPPDEAMSLLLGLVALRRSVERGFEGLAGSASARLTPQPTRSEEGGFGLDDELSDGRGSSASGSLLR